MARVRDRLGLGGRVLAAAPGEGAVGAAQRARRKCRRTTSGRVNQPLVAGTDHAHSTDEVRYYALGRTDAGRRLFVVFTVRDSLIRVISARDMSRR
jgi:hypothetical protein